MKPVSFLLAIAAFSATETINAQKAWELTDRVVIQRPPYTIALTPGGAERNFRAVVQKRAEQLTISFNGSCAAVMQADVRANPDPEVLRRFGETGRGTDLNFADELAFAKDVLLEQCPEMEVLRMEMHPLQRGYDVYEYRGTMTRPNGWSLQDGFVSTHVDDLVPVEIRMRGYSGVIGVNHKGTCEANPTLALAPLYYNLSEEAMTRGQLKRLYHFTTVAETATEQYRGICPQVNSIRYTLEPMPDDFGCSDGSECYLFTSANN